MRPTHLFMAVGAMFFVTHHCDAQSLAKRAAFPSPSAVSLPLTVSDAPKHCADLVGMQIPVSAFVLATGGASITEAAIVSPDAKKGIGEYCRATGEIAAVQPQNPPIRFQVNLPTVWNIKAVQLGGAGFNGVVVTGTDNVLNAPTTAASPLARGYVTLGSDSGHVGMNAKFGLNTQALANFGGESVKRTHDAAMAIIKAYYGRTPQRTYYIGGSKGGHEALIAAQRYGADYDGIVAYYPANQNQAMILSWYRMLQAGRGAAWLNPAKQKLLHDKVLESCDALDGVADGIVSNVEGCRKTFAVNSLRCADGTDKDNSCLSDAQINGLMTAATPMEFSFPLSYGVTSIGPYPVLSGGDVQTALYGDNDTGLATAYHMMTDGVIRYFIEGNESAPSDNFDYLAWQERIQQISKIYDATDADLDAFKRHGGKLILVQGTTDMLVTPTTTTAYVKRVSARYGPEMKSFVRYYLQPGFGHSNGVFNLQWDSLSAMERWSERGEAPRAPIATDANAATKGRTRPLCDYPAWPKYNGVGDVNSAANFKCVSE